MSIDDFQKIINLSLEQGDSFEAREMVYEELIRYMAKGGANQHHLTKIARMIMKDFAISKIPPP